jgi:hypothetical protein
VWSRYSGSAHGFECVRDCFPNPRSRRGYNNKGNIAQTGSDNGPRMAIILAIGAVVVVGICLVIPAFLKKK